MAARRHPSREGLAASLWGALLACCLFFTQIPSAMEESYA